MLRCRVTNYLTMRLLAQQLQPAPASCCAVHPTGLMVAVGFEDHVALRFLTACAQQPRLVPVSPSSLLSLTDMLQGGSVPGSRLQREAHT